MSNWENGKWKQIRDQRGNLIGYVDEFGSTTFVRDQKNGTVGFTKKHDASGPGYSYDFKAGRVAHVHAPEYMLGLRKQKEEDERKRKDAQHRADGDSMRRNRTMPDGDDPEWK